MNKPRTVTPVMEPAKPGPKAPAKHSHIERLELRDVITKQASGQTTLILKTPRPEEESGSELSVTVIVRGGDGVINGWLEKALGTTIKVGDEVYCTLAARYLETLDKFGGDGK